jgi:hypothetical protein
MVTQQNINYIMKSSQSEYSDTTEQNAFVSWWNSSSVSIEPNTLHLVVTEIMLQFYVMLKMYEWVSYCDTQIFRWHTSAYTVSSTYISQIQQS